ncbi:metalloprotease, partial [Flavobacteriaceae bacterium]|nr:metalloprotease [Flavobacteriaceae bacterium]
MRKCLSLLFLFLISSVFSQENEYFIDANFDVNNRLVEIYQTIDFTNTTSNSLNYIILNDWAHSYSNPKTPLGKRLSEDFTLNFQRSTKNQRGFTNIIHIKSDSIILEHERLKVNIDLVKVKLSNALMPNQKIRINIKYNIKIPISDFTGYGIDKENNINLSEWFITL